MSCTTTTISKTFDNVITYEPPPVKLQTVYAPHTVHTFYNSHRVPRLHTVYKSVSPQRIHTVVSTPRIHTIHTEPARVETSIIKVTPSRPATTTTTTTTVAPALYHPYCTAWSYPRFYDDHVIKVEKSVPLRSRSTVGVVRHVDVSDIVSNRYEYVNSNADVSVHVETAVAAPAESVTVTETAKSEETSTSTSTSTTTTTHSGLRPSKSFNGLNTLTYNSFVYDLNHGHDSNHKDVTITKETTETIAPVTVTTHVPGNFSNTCSLLPASSTALAGTYFDGYSYGLLTEHLSIHGSFNVSFSFRTTARDGIVMLIVDPVTSDSFFVELYDSQLRATLLIDGEPDSCWTDFSTPVLSNYVWVNVSIQIKGNRMTMAVNDGYFLKTHRCAFKRPIRGDLFVAGHPVSIPCPYALHSKSFFVGDLRNFSINHDGVRWYGAHPRWYPRSLRYWY